MLRVQLLLALILSLLPLYAAASGLQGLDLQAPSPSEPVALLSPAERSLTSFEAHEFGVLQQAQSIFGATAEGIVISLVISAAVIVGIIGPVLALRSRSGLLPWGIIGIATGSIGAIWTVVLGSGGASMFWIGLPLFLGSVAAIVLGSICIHRWRHSPRRRRRRYYRRRRRRYYRRRRRYQITPRFHHRYMPKVHSGPPLTFRF